MDQSLLESRFGLRKTRYISERFEKSPRITEHCSFSDHLHISYAIQDSSTLPSIRESLLRAYMYAKDWFAYQGDIELELWMAPKVIDLQYMTCLPCDENFFCAPGSQNGIKIILFVSPLSCQKNADKDHLSGCLVHEITHHIVRDISQATVFSMKRKKDLDVPMWIEEGLCQLIQSEVHPYLYHKLSEDIAKTTRWYDFEELWNDLSSCTDTTTAYLQAYKETKTFIETKGKMELIRLLYLNRTHDVNWNNLPYGENNA